MKTLILPAFFALFASVFAKVEVFEISKNSVDLLPGGKEADGIIGDFLIRNGLIECVIGGSADNRKANMGAFWGADGVTPGCLYDLCLRGSNNDQLTIFSPSRQQGKVSYVRPSPGGNGVEVVVSSALSGSLFKRHLYQVKENEAGITIDTGFATKAPSLSRVRSATDGPASIPREGSDQSSGRTPSTHRTRPAMPTPGFRTRTGKWLPKQHPEPRR